MEGGRPRSHDVEPGRENRGLWLTASARLLDSHVGEATLDHRVMLTPHQRPHEEEEPSSQATELLRTIIKYCLSPEVLGRLL